MSRQTKVICMKLEFGSIRQKVKGGTYYFRYQINGQRKDVPLKTHNKNEAERKAKELIPIVKANQVEIVAAHVSAARGFAKRSQILPIEDAWAKYSASPDRAMPHTVSEQLAYQSTFKEFVDFVSSPTASREILHTIISSINEITPAVAEEYASMLRTNSLAVDTHNRKIKRLRKILDVLGDYCEHENPFRKKSLLRNVREEQSSVIRRQAFTREQEQALLRELKNPERKLINKNEIRIIYIIGMYTGQRMKDCVLMQWQNIDFALGQLYVHQYKTGRNVTIPIAPPLLEALREAEGWRKELYVCPKTAARYNKTNALGKNVGNNLVNIDVMRVIRWIRLEPSVKVPGRAKKMTVYGFHSLRHSFCSFCAEANVPKSTLLSILGTDSKIADKFYTHVSSDSQKQAIAAITDTMTTTGDSPQERIRKALALLAQNPEPTTGLLKRLRAILGG